MSRSGRGGPDDDLDERFRQAVSGLELDELRGLVDQILSVAAEPLRRRPDMPSRRAARRAAPVIYRLRIDLDGARPPIWRRLDVRSDLMLDRFHSIIQAAFDWTDSHLHRFALGANVFDRDAEVFLCPFDYEEDPSEGVAEVEVRLDETLAEPGDLLRYCYDYGDSWDHTILLEEVRPLDPDAPAAVCIDGRRAAPPEDSGGIVTAEELAEVVADPAHFDLAAVNRALVNPFAALDDLGVITPLVRLTTDLRGTPSGDDLAVRLHALAMSPTAGVSQEQRAAALTPVRWFLDRVGDDGLPLTAAGYLRPVDVAATAEAMPQTSHWYGRKRREIDTWPVLQFRQGLQRVGLLRKSKGRLLLTKAGHAGRTDPEALWRHLASRFVPTDFRTFDDQATALLILAAATTEDRTLSLDWVAGILREYGWRTDDGPVDHADVAWPAWNVRWLLENVGHAPPSDPTEPTRLSAEATALARDAVLAGRLG